MAFTTSTSQSRGSKPPKSPAFVGDFVFEDLNANGIQDVGESGLANVTVKLLNKSGKIIATTTTAADGSYSFQVNPGTYSLQFVPPSSTYLFSLQNQGSNDAIDSDANPTTGKTASFTLTSNQTNNTIDAGFYRTATIGDSVFLDLNDNGQQDPGESGIEGVAVTLTGAGLDHQFGTSDDLTLTQVTNAQGNYGFTGLTPGIYTVDFLAPGYDFSTPSSQTITLQSGEINNDIDAGLLMLNLDVSIDIDIDSSPALVTRRLDVDNVDTNDDGQYEAEEVPFLLPEVGSTYDQLIRIKNDNSTAASSVILDITAFHDFVKLISVAGDNVPITLLDDGDGNDQTVRIKIDSIPANGEAVIRVTNQVTDSANLVPLDFSYSFLDGSDPEDYGNAIVSGTQYVGGEFVKNAGESTITFQAFDPVELTVAIAGSSSSASMKSLSILRSDAQVTTFAGEVYELFSTDDQTFDADPKTSGKTTYTRTFGLADFLLLWSQDPDLDIQPFINLSGSSDPSGVLNAFLNLVDQGLFGIENSSSFFEKDGETTFAEFSAIYHAEDDGTPIAPFTQTLVAGQVVRRDSIVELTFTGGSFQAFVEANLTDPTKNYIINISPDYQGCDPIEGTTTIDFYNYIPDRTTIGTLYQIKLPAGIDTLLINNRVTQETLDLSATTVLKSNQMPTGVQFSGDSGKNNQSDSIKGTAFDDSIIGSNSGDTLNGFGGNDTLSGGNGKDMINGGQGDDILYGGKGSDTFVFDKYFGNDAIADFSKQSGQGSASSNDIIDLTALGLSESQFNSSISTVNGNLLIDLTAFAGGTITLTGVTSLSISDVIL